MRKQRFAFKGDLKDDSILIGSHGDSVIHVEGKFELSGIIYCPRYIVTIIVKGDGRISFRGKCGKVIVKKIEGNCTLDLSDLTCRELRCECMKGQSLVITGKTRVISKANLTDEAELHIAEKPLITSSMVTGRSKIIHRKLAAGWTAS